MVKIRLFLQDVSAAFCTASRFILFFFFTLQKDQFTKVGHELEVVEIFGGFPSVTYWPYKPSHRKTIFAY